MDFAKRLENLRAYAPIEPPAEIARRLGIPEEKIIKLDANENLYGLPASVCQSLADARLYHIYPDPQQRHIRALISSYTERLAEEIVVGAGSDELIDLLMRLLLNPGDRVLSFTPTFPYYEHLASLNDAHWVGVSRNIDFDIDPESLKNIHWGSVKLVILTSPNNPTGNLVSQALLEEILSKKIWVLLDEAYYEFSQTTHQDLLDRYSNLIILRTSSKMFGMAGLRLGYGLMDKMVAEKLMSIKPPYSINIAAEIAFAAWLQHTPELNAQLQKILATKKLVFEHLRQFEDLKVYPSSANFFLIGLLPNGPFATGKELQLALEKKGVLVRSYGSPALANFFRVSIGKATDMDFFLHELRSLFA